jgi:DNA-nicking Smr family endonuclease
MSKSTNTDHNEWLLAVQGVNRIKTTAPVEKPKPRLRTETFDSVLTHDLHGFTVDAAYQYVLELIEEAQQYGVEDLRIITGKSGMIAREFPTWMNTRAFQPYVRGVSLESSGGSYLIYLLAK